MSILSLPPNPTTDEVVAALETLDPAETDRIVRRLLQVQARRRAPNLSERETELLLTIGRPKRPGFQERFEALSAKSRQFTLTETERDELLRLVDESELFTARRLEALAELSQIRGVNVTDLMRDLGLKAPPVV